MAKTTLATPVAIRYSWLEAFKRLKCRVAAKLRQWTSTMRNKAQNGWYPHQPPPAYLTNKYRLPDKPLIYKDPEKFELVKKLWRIMIEEKPSLDALFETASNMGLVSYTNKAYARSTVHRLFHNPFYYGYFKKKKLK